MDSLFIMTKTILQKKYKSALNLCNSLSLTRKFRRETTQEYDVNGYLDDKAAAVIASFNLVLQEHLSSIEQTLFLFLFFSPKGYCLIDHFILYAKYLNISVTKPCITEEHAESSSSTSIIVLLIIFGDYGNI